MTFGCPKCRQHRVKFGDARCPDCGFELTLQSLREHYRPKSAADRNRRRRLARWIYLFLSVILFLGLLNYYTHHLGPLWLLDGVLSIFFLTFIGLLIKLL